MDSTHGNACPASTAPVESTLHSRACSKPVHRWQQNCAQVAALPQGGPHHTGVHTLQQSLSHTEIHSSGHEVAVQVGGVPTRTTRYAAGPCTLSLCCAFAILSLASQAGSIPAQCHPSVLTGKGWPLPGTTMLAVLVHDGLRPIQLHTSGGC
jgi:hypothetical protein